MRRFQALCTRTTTIWLMEYALIVGLAVAIGLLSLFVARLHASHRWLTGRVRVALDRERDNTHAHRSITEDLLVLDSIVAGSVRQPLDPTTLRWTTPTEPVVLLLPGAAYHIPEITHLAAALLDRGVSTRIASGRQHWLRLETGLRWVTNDVFVLPSFEQLGNDVRAVVTLKDWAGYGDVVDMARQQDVPTFAKVEGAQDFADIDTDQDRRPYTHADHFLCQGQNDYDALSGSRFIVGSTRLERLWHSPPRQRPLARAIINVNFTYGVLAGARDLFVETAVAGCSIAEIPYTLAIHPAAKAGTDAHASGVPISRLLDVGTVLISRFSTVPFEAMARGIPFVYHNPHGERVPVFLDPKGAFDTSTSAGELAEAIIASNSAQDAKQRSSAFFAQQIDINPRQSSADRAASVIASAIE